MTDNLLATLVRIDTGHNLVHLGTLRKAMNMPRAAFDKLMYQARKEGKICLSSVEGRHGISQEDRDAMIVEGQDRLLYASKWN